MARRTVHLHVGLPGTGGDIVPAALARHAEALRAQGICAPAGADEMLRATLEITRDHRAHGLRRRDVEGSWAAICRRAQRERGPVVLGHELLAAATPEQVALLLDGLAGFEVHVLLTATDPASQLAAGWRRTLAAGGATSYARFRRRVLDPARDHPQAREFWAAHDLTAVAARWAAALGDPRRVHVVVPPAGAHDPRPAIWQTLGELVGFEPLALPHDEMALDEVAAAVARGLNDALDGRLGSVEHRQAVAHYLGDAAWSGPRAVPTAAAYADLRAIALLWSRQVTASGYAVIGDLADLSPAEPAGNGAEQGPALEDVLARTTDALADLVVETTRLRQRAAELEARNRSLETRRLRLAPRLTRAS
ncbi:hypothetical protein ACT8ZV_08660 [Nocardioides sp. MAHUQ-72]|uniref:hypothetical protein n=1 Tax=unclassified Nocardioides TaxID=2615069 RepID=UPI003611F756